MASDADRAREIVEAWGNAVVAGEAGSSGDAHDDDLVDRILWLITTIRREERARAAEIARKRIVPIPDGRGQRSWNEACNAIARAIEQEDPT